jgi:hypothetical protein
MRSNAYMKFSSQFSSYIVLAALAIFIGATLVGCGNGGDSDIPHVEVIHGKGDKMKGAVSGSIGGGTPAPAKAAPSGN